MEPLLLLRGVRHVSEIALPRDPKHVSQRAFDEARPRSEYDDLPAARNIVRSLGIGWAEVLALAHESERVQAHRLSHKHMDNMSDYLTPEHVANVLKRMARRLRKDTLSVSDYRIEREAMLRFDRARWLHGRQLIIPTETQIITLMGTWDKALASAGLTVPRTERGGSRRERAPTLPDLLERFYSHYEVQATSTDLRTFARANGIPHRDLRDISFSQALAEWKKSRTARGLPVPLAPPPPSERVDYTRDVGAALPGEKIREREHPLDECIAWMRRYLEGLPASARSTRCSYRDWARQNGAPGPTVLHTKHGGFSRVRRLAQQRMRTERSSRPTNPAP